MVHTQRDPLAVDFVTDNPPCSPLSPLSLSQPPCNHDYKGNLICFIRTKCTPWGLSASFLPHIHGSRSLSLSPNKAFTLYHKAMFYLTSSDSPPPVSNTKDSTWYKNGVLFSSDQQLGNRSRGSEPVYENFAPDVWSAQRGDNRSKHFCSLSLGSFPLQEVINCHHLPSNTRAAAQTETPGPPLELWATYSPAGITQTTA